MITTLLLAIPMAVLWMIVVSSITPGSFFVGYVLGFALLYLMKMEGVRVDAHKMPQQIKAFGVYLLTLGRDIWLSSMDVLKRVLSPDMGLNPGMIPVRTQDEAESDFTAAFSAHGITITPGELVVDFDGNHTMYVHCLDVEASAKVADSAQAKRLHLLKQIKGQ
jgi:multicomponent Na+:H+ antiporter subunit E